MKRLASMHTPVTPTEEEILKSYETLSEETITEMMISILKKSPHARDAGDEAFVLKTTSLMPFFQKIVGDHGIETVRKSFKYLQYEKFNKGATVFNKGDIGSKFYIILKGHVGIVIPQWNGEKNVMKEVHELRSGYSFGELALIDNKPRAATIACKEESHFATLAKENYLTILAEAERRKIENKTEELLKFCIFGEIGRKILSTSLYFFEQENIPLNKTLYKEGEEPNYIYFVTTARCKIQTTIQIPSEEKSLDLSFSSGLPKKVVTRVIEIAILGNGEIMGMEDALLERPRTTTAICTVPGKVYKISTQDFYKKFLMANNDAIAEASENYVRNRESWFHVRVGEIKDQILKNKELYLPPIPSKRDGKRRSDSVDIRNTAKLQNRQTSKSPLRPSKNFLTPKVASQTILDQKGEEVSIMINDKAISNFYITSFLDEAPNLESQNSLNLSQKAIGSAENVLKSILTTKKSYLRPLKPTRFALSKEVSIQNSLERSRAESPKSALEKKRKLSPNRSFDKKRRDEEETKQLFSEGIFETNELNKTFDTMASLNTEKNMRGSLLTSTAPKYISSRPAKPKTNNDIFEKEKHFEMKEKLLEKLEGGADREPWNIQAHLMEVMQEKNDLSRRSQALKQANVTKVKIPLKKKQEQPNTVNPLPDGFRKTIHIQDGVEGNKDHTCIVFHIPKKNSALKNPDRPKLLHKSQASSPKATTGVFELRETPPQEFVANLSNFHKKLNGWKGPYAILNRRLKRKFVKDQLEILHLNTTQT